MTNLYFVVVLLLSLATSAFAQVRVSQPQPGDTVATKTTFTASATTSTCRRGVASMGVYIDNQLAYLVNDKRLNATLSLPAGRHNAVVQAWDYCGGATKIPVPVTVGGQGVWITSPAAGDTVPWNATYTATATTTCAQGIDTLGLFVDDQLVYTVSGPEMNTQVNLVPGKHTTAVESWDNCGGVGVSKLVNVTVKDSGNTFKDIQAAQNWFSWAQIAPYYNDCDAPCTGVSFSMKQGARYPSRSGNATEWNLGGAQPYSDVLFANHLIGPFSSQGMPDKEQKMLPELHNFSYDADFFYSEDAPVQALEFDINWFIGPVGITWGTECRVAGGYTWDIWDNLNKRWVSTGLACHPNPNSWNHVTVNAQRGPNNEVIYQSIVLNGEVVNLKKTYPPFTVPQNWYGITVNYQMDGNQKQTAYNSYVDNFTLRYW
jgi:hypothetical protein